MELDRAIRDGEYAEEGCRVRKDGSQFWARVVITALKRSDGTLRGFSKFTRDLTEQRKVEEELQHSHAELERLNHELENRVSERTAELRDANNELEKRVTERTAELTAANKELEAFTYTAAHDLRAPLRHMHGFVGVLRQTWYEKLDDEGRRCLEKISTSSKDMGLLLDDLLNFSRLARTELRYSPVNLSQMVQRVRQELEPDWKGHSLIWEISELPEVEGDPSLLHQVFFNLIANALKFTRNCEAARIEIGARNGVDNNVTVFVRDNGAGFEMEYVDKLFRVFQRLHDSRDFEGTGIGLAIVRRIVERHGGMAWAEGAPGKGAAFYFSLPVRRNKSWTN
jgi:light-regulated signal transduction histidine kinase (bacteriophytochrome)